MISAHPVAISTPNGHYEKLDQREEALYKASVEAAVRSRYASLVDHLVDERED